MCGLVFLIGLLSVKVESSSFGDIRKIVNATLQKVNEVENGSNIELIGVGYAMRTSGYLRSDIEITENKVKTFCVLTINEEFYMDHADVVLRCIPDGGGNNKMIIISLIWISSF